MRFLSGSLVFLSALALLPGCSDSKSSSSSTSNIDGWVGAQGLNNAQVVVNQVAESGQVSVDGNGIYFGLRESTNTASRFTASVANDEVLLFIARGQSADVDKDKDNLATQRQCQVAQGCTVSGAAYGFADFYSATSGFEWRSIAYTVSDGSRNNVNAITTLASAFAFQFDVNRKIWKPCCCHVDDCSRTIIFWRVFFCLESFTYMVVQIRFVRIDIKKDKDFSGNQFLTAPLSTIKSSS